MEVKIGVVHASRAFVYDGVATRFDTRSGAVRSSRATTVAGGA